MIHIIHPDSTYPRRPPGLRDQGCWSKSGWNRVIVEKPFGKNGPVAMDWWKITRGIHRQGCQCDASFPWGKRRLNHHSTVWKNERCHECRWCEIYDDIFRNEYLDDVYTYTKYKCLYVYMLHVRVTCRHEESNQCENGEAFSAFSAGISLAAIMASAGTQAAELTDSLELNKGPQKSSQHLGVAMGCYRWVFCFMISWCKRTFVTLLESLDEFLQLTLLADALGQSSYEVLGKCKKKTIEKNNMDCFPIIFLTTAPVVVCCSML